MELEKCNEELEDEREMKKAEYLEQIDELEVKREHTLSCPITSSPTARNIQ